MNAAFADAVVVAAGSSSRMGGVDKLTELLLGRPLLAWSVEAMSRARSVDRIVVVVRPDRVAEMETAAWRTARTVIVAGGGRRSDSVRAGVAATTAEIVLVHDAARPLATAALADSVAAAARTHGAAVPVLPVVDSLKRVAGAGLESVDRDGLLRSQTPQAVRREVLLAAFEAAGAAAFTDEAALLESQHIAVATIPGEPANMKITQAADLELVRELTRGRAQERLGFGQDSHPFGPGLGLRLGGVEMADAPRLYGHSDGDAVLHALATAVLSAAGLGDLGRLFPSSDVRTAGADSAQLLAHAVAEAGQAGWRVSRAQVSLIGARPRLGGRRLDQIRDRLAELVGVSSAEVAVNASTGNLGGAEGAGRAISATALVTVVRR